MTTWMVILFVCAGIAAGAALGGMLARSRKFDDDVRCSASDGPEVLMWDMHALLNSMNKLAIAAERGRPVEAELIYLLSDYLLQGVLIQREDGWVDKDTLKSWLLAYMSVRAHHLGQDNVPTVSVHMPELAGRVQVRELWRELWWHMQKVQFVSSIDIQVDPSGQSHHSYKVRASIGGGYADLQGTQQGGTRRPWRIEDGVSVCELPIRWKAINGAQVADGLFD